MHNHVSYEEYMRTVLGYQPSYLSDLYRQEDDYYALQSRNDFNYTPMQQNLEAFYPECYSKIYPTVCKACSQFSGQLTIEQLEKMTDDIYDSIYIVEVRKEDKSNKTAENREVRRRDNSLRDLIKILILRELLGGGRPIFPGPGPRPPRPRPPFPGPGPRPPMPR